MMTNDAELLKRYLEDNSNEAFEELITRHTGLVYSAALRQVRNHDLAQEVAQAVFIILARKARRLSENIILSGWLYRTTWFAATKVIQQEQRRQFLEQESLSMNAHDSHEESVWQKIEPHLDDAMKRLGEAERTALILRYFENKNLREVGTALGTSENAAQKRITRALEKLRGLFSKKALLISTAALSGGLSANAIAAPPAGMTLQIALATTAKGTAAAITTATLVKETITMMTYAKLKIAAPLVAGALILGGTPIALQQKKIGTLETEAETLRIEVLQLQNQEPQYVTDPNLVAEVERLRENATELQRLRGEVGMLRRDNRELNDREAARTANTPDMESAVHSWMVRFNLLQDRLQQTPEAALPEFHLLTREDWLEAAKGKLNTEEDYRKALGALRSKARAKLANIVISALGQFATDNDQGFPEDLAQLKPYFREFVDDSVLEGYEIIPSDRIETVGMGGDWIITQKVPVDEEYDSRIVIGPNGFGTTSYISERLVQALKVLRPIIDDYSLTHDVRSLTDYSELAPFIRTPEQQIALENAMEAREAIAQE